MSTDNPHVMVQPLEYLGLAEGVVSSPPNERPVVAITMWPDPPNWWWSAILLLCGLLAATIGCSGRVEVESSKWAAPPPASSASNATTGEKARTAIQLDLLQTRPSEPPPSPKPTSSANTVILNVGSGDVHVGGAPAHAEADGKPARPRSGLNTKIGWPSAYWEHGPSAFTGSVAVWVLMGTAVVLMIATVGCKDGGPMLSIVEGVSRGVLIKLWGRSVPAIS